MVSSHFGLCKKPAAVQQELRKPREGFEEAFDNDAAVSPRHRQLDQGVIANIIHAILPSVRTPGDLLESTFGTR